MIFFFFSSRRRHTRSLCDWSSDVCSSDLSRDPQRGGEERMTQPLIAVTMGDPAGIGPEIIVRAFDEGDFRKHNRTIVVGDAGILERAARLLDLALRANVVAE